jgi:ABC-type lipopolysaccharide export system ATPase subunit
LIPGAGSADFLSANEVVIYNGSQFYVTRDAARTWSIIPPDVLFDESFAGMDFVNTGSIERATEALHGFPLSLKHFAIARHFFKRM